MCAPYREETMKVQSLLLAFLAVGLLTAPAVVAQEEEEEEAQANVVVMRYFECDLGKTDQAIELLNGAWRDVVDQLQEEGLIQGYGILAHYWGDEWNLADWMAVENMHASHEAWSEAFTRYMALEGAEEDIAKFTEVCSRHKDNIYEIIHPRTKEAEE
jgi:hypothetical protein